MDVIQFPVEAGHITMFARAIGDPNPVYNVLETDADQMAAPPTFVQARAQFDPDYPLRPAIGARDWFGSGATAGGARNTGSSGAAGGRLHAEQHYEYHKPVRPGMVLTASTSPGRSWQKQSRRGGTLHFNELVTEIRDQDGDLVVVARSVGVRTESRPADD